MLLIAIGWIFLLSLMFLIDVLEESSRRKCKRGGINLSDLRDITITLPG